MVERTSGTPDRWDEQADLVVIGSGAAGLTGALVAAAEGADALILEKTDMLGGTTSVSGGGAWIPNNHHMPEVGVEDSDEEALEYVRALGAGAADDELLVALVEHGKEMVRFLEDRAGVKLRPWPAKGGTLDYRPWLAGAKPGGRTLDPGKVALADAGEWADRIRLGRQSEWKMDKLDYYTERMHTWPPKEQSPSRWRRPDDPKPEYLSSGTALVVQLVRGCIAHGVRLSVDTPVESLVIEEGRVAGVRAQRDGQPFFVRARTGVLMATGGYAHNEELKRLWLRRPLELSCEIEANQGDGHLMGMAAGAQVAGLGDAWWMPHVQLESESDTGALNVGGTREDRSLPHTIIVNTRGRRFVNESLNYNDVVEAFGTKQDGPKNLPAWLIFDQQGRERYNMLAMKITGDAPTVEGATLTELAGRLGIDAAGLTETVERFNGFAREGKDLDFGRGESAWDLAWGDPANEPNPSLGTLERGPFYAIEIHSGALATKGGLRVNARGEVIAAAGDTDVIPGLYAAGNCSSGSIPDAYAGAGATIGPAMTLGYLIGTAVAAASRSVAA